MTITDLCKEAHKTAVEKGFWDKDRNKSELLMLIVSELGEACEALRNGKRQRDLKRYEVFKKKLRERTGAILPEDGWEKDTFEDELADAVIRIADLAESQGINLEWQIQKKMAFNATRERMHGKKF